MREVHEKGLRPFEANDNRDAVSKSLYDDLFAWLITKCNEALYDKDTVSEANNRFIGVLDVFGFEYFPRNSFEQFCINFANERLQQVRERIGRLVYDFTLCPAGK